MPDDTPYLPLERAKRRIEGGDLSFEAFGELCKAHSEVLLRDYCAPPRRSLYDNFTPLVGKFGPPTDYLAAAAEEEAKAARFPNNAEYYRRTAAYMRYEHLHAANGFVGPYSPEHFQALYEAGELGPERFEGAV